MTDSEPELYVPKPGSIPWRVLNFLLENPDEELTRGDVAVKFDCIGGGIDTMLQLAVARECLKKSRNTKNEMIWILGMVKRFRLDPMPTSADDEQVQRLEAALTPTATSAPPPAPAKEVHRAIKVVDISKTSPAEKPAPEDSARKGTVLPMPSPIQHHTPVTVNMPPHLTPELIEAVNTDPTTRFENNAERHQAIGWLFSAYEVMVRHQATTARQ